MLGARQLALAGLVTVVTALGASAGAPAAADPTVQVQILSFNDFHGALEPPVGGDGGVVNLSTLVQQRRADNPNTITAGAGDVIGLTPQPSAAFHDEPAIEAMNVLGLDVTSVGNHEFDDGWVELLRRRYGSQAGGSGCHPVDGCQDGDGFGGAAFGYLAANVVEDATGRPILPPTQVREIGGVKVGFIGVTFEGTPEQVDPAGIAGLTFLDEADTVNRYAAELQAQGVQTIVVLLHQGLRGAVDPNGCGATGRLTDIVGRMGPAVDTVVSGHTHETYLCTINGKLVTSAGVHARYLTDIDLTVDTATGDVVGQTATNLLAAAALPDDPCLLPLIEKYRGLNRPSAPAGCRSATAPQGGSAASVTLTGNASRITAGNRPELSGVVTDALGHPVPDSELVLWEKPYGATAYQPSPLAVRTDATGAFSVLVAPHVQTSYTVRAATLRQSPVITIAVARRVEITAPTHAASVVAPVRIAARLTPGEPLTVGLGRIVAGRYGYLGQAVTAADGSLDLTRPLPSGTYALVVYTSARQGVLAGSRSVQVTVVR